MYHPTGIQKLSHNQILKLLRGHRVRVKHGSHHNVHLSKEQHKKLMAAHKKGAGITLQFDPFQQQMEDHIALKGKKPMVGKGTIWKDESGKLHHEGPHMQPMEGKGWLTDFAKGALKEVAPHLINYGAEKAKKYVEGMGRKRGRPKKGSGLPITLAPHLHAPELHPHVAHVAKRGRPKKGGSAFTDFFTKTIPKAFTPSLAPASRSAIPHTLPGGNWSRTATASRPSQYIRSQPVKGFSSGKVGRGKKKGCGAKKKNGGALYPPGYDASSGGALYPAGYDSKHGNGKKRGRKGKGIIGSTIGKIIGSTAGRAIGGKQHGAEGEDIGSLLGGLAGGFLPF